MHISCGELYVSTNAVDKYKATLVQQIIKSQTLEISTTLQLVKLLIWVVKNNLMIFMLHLVSNLLMCFVAIIDAANKKVIRKSNVCSVPMIKAVTGKRCQFYKC